MLRRARETGPIALVPLAWTFATVAHLDLLESRTVLIAHLVMDAILVAFTVLSWREMQEGVLRVWRTVLVVGLGLTLVGTGGLLVDPPSATLLAGVVLGWMVVPAAGLLYTGQHVAPDSAPWVYTVGAVLSGLGAVGYVAWLFGVGGTSMLVDALVLVGLGQTAGIVNAVFQY